MALSIRNRIVLGYPINVMCDVFKIKSIDNVSIIIMDLNKKLPFLFKRFDEIFDSFMPKQKEAVIYYYKENLPTAIVAQKMDCTRQRVHQLLAAVIKKLGAPDIIKIFQTKPGDPNTLEDGKFNHFVYTTFGTLDVPYNTPIENYDLSLRSYTCLKKLGIDTLGKVLIYDFERKLKNTRNLGEISITEIRSKMYVIPSSDEPLLLSENLSYVGKERLLWLAKQLELKEKPTQALCHEAAKQLRFLASVEIQLSELFAAFYISVNKE